MTDNWTSNASISLSSGQRGNVVSGTVVVSDGNWPRAAKRVMDEAGVQRSGAYDR